MINTKHSSTPKRFLLISGIIFTVVLIVVGILTWAITSNQVLQQMKARLINFADSIDREITSLINLGRESISIPLNIMEQSFDQQAESLSNFSQANHYFQEIFLLDGQGRFINGYPNGVVNESRLTPEDLTRIHSVITGADSDLYIVKTADTSQTYLTFLKAVKSSQGQLAAILVCRSILDENPFASIFLTEMNSIEEGMAFLFDNYKKEIYISDTAQVGLLGDLEEIRTNQVSNISLLNGMSGFAYSKAISAEPWILVLFIPDQYIINQVYQIVIPIVLIFLVTLLAILFGIYWQLRKAYAKIEGYSQRILGTVRTVSDQKSSDWVNNELGRLQFALTSMQENLDLQIEEQRALRSIATYFVELDPKTDVFGSIATLLIKKGADSVRMKFTDPTVHGTIFHQSILLKWGSQVDTYEYLEDQIIDIVKKQDPLLIPNVNRSKQLHAPNGKQLPAALAAFGIQNNGEYFGAFWLAFEQPKIFNKEEISFITGIANEIGNGIGRSRKLAYIQNERNLLIQGLDSIKTPMLLYQQNAGIIFANRALLDLGDIMLPEWLFKKLDDVVLEPQVRSFLCENDSSARSKNLELGGKTYQLTKYPLQDIGRTGGWICLFMDISPYLEKEKNQLEFFSLVNHDLRSPMTLIRGYVNMLEMVGSINEQQKNYVTKINSNIDGMTSLVNSVLDLERLESGAEIQTEVLNPVDVLDNVSKNISPIATQKNIKLTFERGEHGILRGDQLLLEQALYNLVENAIRYSSVGGKVEVKIQSDVSNIKFVIEDHGVGISPIDLPNIFLRPKPSTSRDGKTETTGFGLVLVKAIVDRHRGIIRAESHLGKGSRFTIEIPRGTSNSKNIK